MSIEEKRELKHELINAIVIINSITKSASNFLYKLSEEGLENDINQNKLNKFLYSMSIIREQTEIIKNCFERSMYL